TDAETDRKNLKEPETVSATILGKTLEIVSNGTPEKSSAENLKPTAALPRNARRNGGRNQPCPCGSGRKRKRCHPEGVPSAPAPERRPAPAQAERQSSSV
ncbi:MAG: hypothetical protein F4Y04_05675, partial [Chloroflexi bacterium]|nr:hypothetical protein [Chloroflexota bacterium]